MVGQGGGWQGQGQGAGSVDACRWAQASDIFCELGLRSQRPRHREAQQAACGAPRAPACGMAWRSAGSARAPATRSPRTAGRRRAPRTSRGPLLRSAGTPRPPPGRPAARVGRFLCWDALAWAVLKAACKQAAGSRQGPSRLQAAGSARLTRMCAARRCQPLPAVPSSSPSVAAPCRPSSRCCACCGRCACWPSSPRCRMVSSCSVSSMSLGSTCGGGRRCEEGLGLGSVHARHASLLPGFLGLATHGCKEPARAARRGPANTAQRSIHSAARRPPAARSCRPRCSSFSGCRASALRAACSWR